MAVGGHLVRWADQRFAHRFAGGPPPQRPSRYGRERTRHEWQLFGKAVLAWAITCGLLAAAMWWVGDETRVEPLRQFVFWMTVSLGIYLVVFPLWATLFPRREPTGATDRSAPAHRED